MYDIYDAKEYLKEIKGFCGGIYNCLSMASDAGIECLSTLLRYPGDNYRDELDKLLFTPQGLQTFIDLLAILLIPPGSVWFAKENSSVSLMWFPRYMLHPKGKKQWIAVLQPFLDYVADIPILRLKPWPLGFISPVRYSKDAYIIRPDFHAFTKEHFSSGSVYYSCINYHPSSGKGLVDNLSGERLTGEALYHYLTENGIKGFW